VAETNTCKLDPTRFLPDKLLMPHLPSWTPDRLVGIDSELVHYCKCPIHELKLRYVELTLRFKIWIVASTAFSSLVAFDQDVTFFRDLLLQMALSSSTGPSRAVLFALLAVSSQHRDGLQSQALSFKTSAISALVKSAESGALGTTEAAQHVAAGMLLCSFEVRRICCRSTGECC
jgi:hypothetical protein